MRHWREFAGLADEHRERPLRILFGNPFRFNDDVYPKVVAALEKAAIEERPNLAFLREITHPAVDRHGPAMAPGWNASNAEIKANDEDGCYVLFDRAGDLVFQGRLGFPAISAKVRALLDRR